MNGMFNSLRSIFGGQPVINNNVNIQVGRNTFSNSSNVDDGSYVELDLSEKVPSTLKTLSINSAFDVELVISPDIENSLNIHISEKYKNSLKVQNSGSKLHIDFSENVNLNRTPKIVLSAKTLENLNISGAVDLVGNINSPNLELKLSGACDVELLGKIDNFKLDCSGACDVDVTNVDSNSMDIIASGASTIKANSDFDVSLDISGASDLSVAGKPNIRKLITAGASNLIIGS